MIDINFYTDPIDQISHTVLISWGRCVYEGRFRVWRYVNHGRQWWTELLSNNLEDDNELWTVEPSALEMTASKTNPWIDQYACGLINSTYTCYKLARSVTILLFKTTHLFYQTFIRYSATHRYFLQMHTTTLNTTNPICTTTVNGSSQMGCICMESKWSTSIVEETQIYRHILHSLRRRHHHLQHQHQPRAPF